VGLGTALAQATTSYYSKKVMKNLDEYFAAWALAAFVLFFCSPLVMIIMTPWNNLVFWASITFNSVFFALSLIMYMRGIRLSPLSLSMPFIALTPVFMIFTGWLFLGEVPSAGGAVGVLLIGLGAYLLKASELRNGLLAPFKKIASEPGVRYMVLTSFLWGLTAPTAKLAIVNSDPYTFIIWDYGIATLILTPILLCKKKRAITQVKKNFWKLVPIGLTSAISIILMSNLLTMTLAVYAIALKRMSVLFSSLYGMTLLGEKRAIERLLGAAVMLLGVIAIALS